MKTEKDLIMLAKLNKIIAISHLSALHKELEKNKKDDSSEKKLYEALIRLLGICENIFLLFGDPLKVNDLKKMEAYANTHTYFETVADFICAIYQFRKALSGFLTIKDVDAMGEVYRFTMFMEMAPDILKKPL
ncbi:hypothetical protein ACX8XN_18495 [Calditrichota bacterium GD2]